jgi:hypothetical protein
MVVGATYSRPGVGARAALSEMASVARLKLFRVRESLDVRSSRNVAHATDVGREREKAFGIA